MSISVKQNVKLTQQLILTPQLQQAIKILQLSRLELKDYIEESLKENPLLEERETIEENILDLLDYRASYSNVREVGGEKKEFTYENYLKNEASLSEHLLWQLNLSSLNEEEIDIGRRIIGNMDNNGYLTASLEEIAESTKSSEDVVEKVLKKIQEFDPPGVGARDLRECLLIQARHLNLTGGVVEEVIRNYLPDLGDKNYQKIADTLNVSLEDVEKVAKIISQMNPKPGSEFDKERIEYIVPDIYLYKLGDEYFILLNNDGLPKLRINPLYLKILRSKNSYPEEVRAYIHNKLTAAVWLIKSIHQRETTLYKVTESIVKFQREFFDKGIAYLKPLTLKDVGDDINMHESTISRVTTNKYISTPQGIFELKFFFSSGIRGLDGKHVTSIWIKNRIKDIISKENPKKPLSDNMISEILKRSGIKISRRTVAKYRESIGILPSSKRKRMF